MMVDLIVENGRIHTGDPEAPVVDAVAVLNGRIVAAGNDVEGLRARERVDAHDRVVLPGFNDAHAHSVWFGMTLIETNLSGVRSLDDLYRTSRKTRRACAAASWTPMRPDGRLPCTRSETPACRSRSAPTGPSHPAPPSPGSRRSSSASPKTDRLHPPPERVLTSSCLMPYETQRMRALAGSGGGAAMRYASGTSLRVATTSCSKNLDQFIGCRRQRPARRQPQPLPRASLPVRLLRPRDGSFQGPGRCCGPGRGIPGVRGRGLL